MKNRCSSIKNCRQLGKSVDGGGGVDCSFLRTLEGVGWKEERILKVYDKAWLLYKPVIEFYF